MLNKIFESKLLKEAFIMDIPKLKYQQAAELYSENEIIIKENTPSSVSFILKDMKIEIKSEVIMTYYINGKKVKKDENIAACLLAFKRDYIVNNEIKFNVKEFVVENNYYNNTYVTFFNIDEYKLRINFNIGVINSLYNLDMKNECLEYIVDFYYELYNNFTFDNRYGDLKYFFKYQIVKNKQEFIIENTSLLIELANEKDNNLFMLTDIINLIGVNFPNVLKNNKLMSLYDYILKNSKKSMLNGQMFNNLTIYKEILKWYNGENNEQFMAKNITKPEVRYCYIKYLSENKRYQDICKLIVPTTFNITNPEINLLITEAFYECEDYEGAVGIFNRFNGITYERYLAYKEKFPILFNDPYLDSIITYMVENYDDEDVQKIIIDEKLEKYQIFALAKEDFDILDSRFDDFVGKYDDALIKIYQKEIIKTIESLQGRYNYIPEQIIRKFEKMKRIKNGKYYIAETIYYMLDTYYIAYSKELRKYLSLLGV